MRVASTIIQKGNRPIPIYIYIYIQYKFILGCEAWGIKQKKSSWGSIMNNTLLWFYSPTRSSLGAKYEFEYVENSEIISQARDLT